jgi:hypothetical protein
LCRAPSSRVVTAGTGLPVGLAVGHSPSYGQVREAFDPRAVSIWSPDPGGANGETCAKQWVTALKEGPLQEVGPMATVAPTSLGVPRRNTLALSTVAQGGRNAPLAPLPWAMR